MKKTELSSIRGKAQLPYLGQCDRVRRQGAHAEAFWHEMMLNKQPTTMRELEAACNVSAILDEGESLWDFVDKNDHGFFKSKVNGQPVWFVSSAGFEFIFAEKGPATSTVGAKPKWNDPSYDGDKLAKQAIRVPKTYTNPNLPLDALMEGARRAPWYVEQNPVLQLVALEDPARYHELLQYLDTGWTESGAYKLSDASQRLYAIECAERVIHLVEKHYPAKGESRAAIEAARKFVAGEISADKMSLAGEKAFKLAERIAKKVGTGPTNKAAYAAFATTLREKGMAASIAAIYARQATKWAPNYPVPKVERPDLEELKWQANRVRYYYGLEHPEYQPLEAVGAKKKWDDASQTPQVLKRIAKKNPKAYTNPNMDMDDLLGGARLFPWLVEQNPVLGLLQLEDPARHLLMLEALNHGWILAGITQLTPRQQRSFAIDCAERCINHEFDLHSNNAARDAIEASRKYMNNEASVSQLREAQTKADRMAVQIESYIGHGNTSYAVRSVVACASLEPLEAASDASYFCRNSMKWGGKGRMDHNYTAELQWQADRVRAYYAQNHPEYQLPATVGAKKKSNDPSVGARKPPKWSDPSADPDQLAKQAIKVPKTYTNPNIRPGALILGAKKYPLLVEKNPLLGLLSLDNPHLFKEIQAAMAEGWRDIFHPKLSDGSKRLWAADCAMHVLPILENYPTAIKREKRPLQAIQAAMAIGKDPGNPWLNATLVESNHDAYTCYSGLQSGTSIYEVAKAAYDCSLSDIDHAQGAAYHAGLARYYSASVQARSQGSTQEKELAREAQQDEFIWQGFRVRHYYMLEHPELQTPDSVGAKWNDPQADPEQLAKQARKVPKTYMNPNLPPSALVLGAANYPLYVEQNPVLALLQLEDPVSFQQIKLNLAVAWSEKMYEQLSSPSKRLYAADCAEHVLPLFEKAYPTDRSVRNAIQAAREFAQSPNPSITGLIKAAADVEATGWRVRGGTQHPSGPVESACQSAERCVNGEVKVIKAAAHWARLAVRAAAFLEFKKSHTIAESSHLALDEQNRERIWQANRVRFYYSQEHPEYQPALDLVGTKRTKRKN